MDNVTNILQMLIGGGLVAGIIEVVRAVRYRKEAKTLKENEAKVSNVDAQRQEIDLAVHFKDEMITMMKQFSEKQDKGNDNQGRILDKLDRLEDKVDGIETYLNGPYHEWLANKELGREGAA